MINYRSTIIFCSLFILISLIVYWDQNQLNYKKYNLIKDKRLVKIFNEQMVSTFSIRRPRQPVQKITFTKIDANWIITEPNTYPADIVAVRELLREIIFLYSFTTIDIHGKPLEPFGLDPAHGIEITLSSFANSISKTTQHFLIIGNETIDHKAQYVKVGDKVHITDLSIKPLLNKALPGFRKKEIIEFNPDQISQIKIGINDVIQIDRNKNLTFDVFSSLNPLPTPANTEHINDFLWQIEKIRVFNYLNQADHQSLFKAVLQNPIQQITVMENFGKRRIHIKFFLWENRLFAKHARTTELLECRPSNLNRINVTIENFTKANKKKGHNK